MKADVKIIPRLNNLELTKVNVGNEGHQSKHYHHELSFAVVTQGSGKFLFKNSSQNVRRGAIIKIAPGDVHSSGKSNDSGSMEYRVFYIPRGIVNTILDEEEIDRRGDLSFKNQVSYNTDFFSDLFRSHLKLSEENDIMLQESVLSQVVLTLLKRYGNQLLKLPKEDQKPSYLETIVDYFEAYYDETIYLSHLSQLIKRSPSQIIRTFHRHYGISPHSYLMNLRISKGKELLSGDAPIAQIAQQTGFNDQSHFHKNFKRIVHVTPGQFRRSIRR